MASEEPARLYSALSPTDRTTHLHEGVVVDDAHVLCDGEAAAQREQRRLEFVRRPVDAYPLAVQEHLGTLHTRSRHSISAGVIDMLRRDTRAAAIVLVDTCCAKPPWHPTHVFSADDRGQ